MGRKIVLAGGSGLLGKIAADYFLNKGDEVIILTRNKDFTYKQALVSIWDGKNEAGWSMCLENADALINFTGKSIQCVHTEENLNQILKTRVDSINALYQAIHSCENPPKVFIQTSATAIFGNHQNMNDEESDFGNDHLAKLCIDWEKSFNDIEIKQTRKVILRIGIILTQNGGALAPLKKISKLMLGGKAGNGKQYISWCHEYDFISIINHIITNQKIDGSFNACTSYPLTNKEFMRTLRRSLGVPFGIGAPAFAIKIVGRKIINTDPSLILYSNRSHSKRLKDEGFKFLYPELKEALADLC